MKTKNFKPKKNLNSRISFLTTKQQRELFDSIVDALVELVLLFVGVPFLTIVCKVAICLFRSLMKNYQRNASKVHERNDVK
jgi:hypothetical protein